MFGPFCGEKYVAFFRSRFRQYFVFREIGFSKNPKLLVFCFVDMCFKVFINFLILNCFFFCFCFSDVNEEIQEYVILGMIFATAMGLIAGCHYAGSSHLLVWTLFFSTQKSDNK